MSFTALFGVLLSVAWMSTLVVGSPEHVAEFTEFVSVNCENDYFKSVVASAKDTDRGSALSLALSVTKTIPGTAEANFEVTLSGQDPIQNDMELSDCLEDKTVGEGFVATAEGGFPKGGSIPSGDYKFLDYIANLDALPSGSEGDMDGSFTLKIDGILKCTILFKAKYYPKPEVSG